MENPLRFVYVAIALGLVAGGCGPMPGYYPEPRPEQRARSSRQIVRIKTDQPGTYYLIDVKRRLCFFQTKGAVATIDCAQIPEAKNLIGETTSSAPAATMHPQPHDGHDTASRPPDPADDRSTEAPQPRAKSPDMGEAPSVDEKRRFTLAYIAIFCARASGDTTAPTQHIEREGLTVQRYSQIEGWMASDPRVWRALSSAARNACPRTPEPKSPEPAPTPEPEPEPEPETPDDSWT